MGRRGGVKFLALVKAVVAHYVRRIGVLQFKKVAIRNEIASCRKLASTTNQWANVEFSLGRDLIFEKTGILELQYFEF